MGRATKQTLDLIRSIRRCTGGHIRLGRARKLTPDLIRAIQRDSKRGHTYVMLKRKYGVSIGTIGNAIKHRFPETESKRKPRKKKRRPTPPAGGPPESEDVRQIARDLVEKTRANLEHVEDTSPDDHAAIGAATRQYFNAVALLAKHTPQADPPPDPNEQPDFVAAAKNGRAKIHAILDRVHAERAAAADAAPKCERCAQPMTSAATQAAHDKAREEP